MVNFVDEYSDGIRPRLTVAVLNGEIALVGASGEFFCQHANRLRERARVRQLFFFGYCNGYHQYFPTIEAAAEGGLRRGQPSRARGSRCRRAVDEHRVDVAVLRDVPTSFASLRWNRIMSDQSRSSPRSRFSSRQF